MFSCTLQERQQKLQQQQANEQPSKVVTPDPDYDITPPNSLDHTTNQLIDKVKAQQPESASIRQSTDAPKGTSSVAIKIGEYADRKEPCKFHFISKVGSNECSGDVSSQLKNELEKTLSKLNIQNKKVKRAFGFECFELCFHFIILLVIGPTGERRRIKESRTFS